MNATTTTSEMPNTMKDSTEWITANPVADFLLMYSAEIRYLCMFAYCFLHGKKRISSTKEANFDVLYINQ